MDVTPWQMTQGFYKVFSDLFEETHFNLLFSKNEKKLKYLIKNFMMVRIEVDWMHFYSWQ